MKFSLLIFLCCITCLYTNAQSNAWFKGSWYGERTFPDAPIAKKALLRMEIDAMQGDLFTGQLIYMYPSDTTARLIRKIGGQLYGRYVIINKSEEIYRMDPRSRSFWSDCSHCPGASSFYIDNGDLVLQITASACGDSCNGTTTFRRKIEDYNAATQAILEKKFSANKLPVSVSSNPLPVNTSDDNLNKQRDSIKYFPNVLNDSMRVNFDPSKYVLPNSFFKDTISSKRQTTLNKGTKQNNLVPLHASVKDSVVVIQKKGIDSTAKVAAQDSINLKNIARHKDTAQVVNKPVNTATAKALTPTKNSSAAASIPLKNNTDRLPASISDSVAALPATVKDTVPAAITQRTTRLITTYQVSSPHIAVQLFDDGQIDGDAVSVYYNGKVIINNQTLTHKAITFTLEASATNRHHEFILISESEGFLQPNTALMRIKAGSQQFELTVSSSSARNAKIEINYVGE